MSDKKILVSMDNSGLHIVDESVARKLEKKNISPSLITGLEKCSARWMADNFVLDSLIDKEPDTPARRGNLYHSVMEVFFAFDPEERTNEKLREIVDETLNSDEYSDLADNSEVVAWLRNAVNGYFRMGGRPKDVRVAEIEDSRGVKRKGLEVFVKGRIGNAKREVLGFVDRIVEDQRSDSGAVVVEDWKTGAKAEVWNPKNKSLDGLGEARQQTIYSMLLAGEGYGLNVSGARLIYPVVGTVVNVDIGDKAFQKRVIEDVEKADEKLDFFIDKNSFEFSPFPFCAWCPLAKICPEANILPYQKMQDAFAKQPEPEVLLEGIEIL